MSTATSNKVFRRVKKGLSIFLSVAVALVFLLLCVVFVSRITGNANGAFGFHFNVIASGSMEPEIQVGDVIISRTYRGQELKVGDVVTYVATSGEKTGSLITHEIIAIDEGGDGGSRMITTQGVANTLPDTPIREDEVVSVMVYNTVVIKYIYRVVTHPIGFLLIVVLPLVLAIISEVYDLVKQLKERKNETDERS